MINRLLLLVIFASFNVSALNSIIVCAEDKAYPPILNGKSFSPEQNPGLIVDVLLQAAHRLHLDIKLIRRPWERCKQMVKQGKSHALMPMIKTDSRAKEFSFPSNPLYLAQFDYYVYFNKLHKHKTLLSELNQRTQISQHERLKLELGVSAPRGYVSYKKLNNMNLLPKQTYSLEHAMQVLAINKLDGFVFEGNIANAKLKSLQLHETVIAGQQPFMSERLYLVFNKRFYQQHKTTIDKYWLNIRDERMLIFGN